MSHMGAGLNAFQTLYFSTLSSIMNKCTVVAFNSVRMENHLSSRALSIVSVRKGQEYIIVFARMNSLTNIYCFLAYGQKTISSKV